MAAELDLIMEVVVGNTNLQLSLALKLSEMPRIGIGECCLVLLGSEQIDCVGRIVFLYDRNKVAIKSRLRGWLRASDLDGGSKGL